MKDIIDKTIFIAGATGLAGSAIILNILNKYPNAKIKGTYYHTQPFIKDDRISYIQADLTKKDDCIKAVKGCDVAIMAAAVSGGARQAISTPHRQLTDNLVMDTLLLEAMFFENITRIVYLSSATVYQEFDGYIKENEIDLNMEPHPSYRGVGWAKRSAEKICHFWHDKYGMEIIIARCSNIYGPYAKFDPSVSNFIPALIRKAVDRNDPFEVWGNPIVERDVIYSEDMAQAVILLLINENIKFDVFNLGYGKTVTVDKVVHSSLSHSHHNPKNINYSENEPETIRVRALNCDKIKHSLDWSPVNNIENGIQKTTQWWVQHKEKWKK